MDFLSTGAHGPPQSYPTNKTVHRRFQTWCCNEILRLILTDVANELRETARWMKKNASSMRRSLWPKVAGRKSDQRSAEKA